MKQLIGNPMMLQTILLNVRMLAVWSLVVLGALGCEKTEAPSPDAQNAPSIAELPGSATSTVIGAAEDPTLTFALPRSGGPVDHAADRDEPLVLAFSEPMVPLTAVEQPTEWTGTTVAPPLALRWRWLTTDTVMALPAGKSGDEPGTWPAGADIRVQLPADLRTREGQPFPQPVVHQFHTAAPRLAWTVPEDRAAFLPRDVAVALAFNQPIDLEDARAHVQVEPMRPGTPVPPWELRRPTGARLAALKTSGKDASDGAVVEVAFRKILPPWEGFRVRITPGVRSLSGPRVSPLMEVMTFETSGPESAAKADALVPFELRRASPDVWLDPETSNLADLDFSAQLAPTDHTKLLKIVPPVGGAYLSCWSAHCSIHGDFKPFQTYTATIGAGLQDAHGRTLGKPLTLTRRFGHYQPRLEVVTEGSVMEFAQLPHAVGVQIRNLQHVQARAWRVPASTPVPVLEHLQMSDPGYAAALATLGPPTALPLGVNTALDVSESRVLQLGPLLAGKPGQVWVEITTPDIHRDQGREWGPDGLEGRLFQVTDLHVGVKSSEKESLIWVTSLQTGQPVAGAKVSVRDETDAVLWRGTTGAEGLVLGPGEPPMATRNKQTSRTIWAEKGDDAARLEWLRADSWYPWQSETAQNDRWERGWMLTDKPLYRLGETIQVKGIVRLAGKDALGLPPAGQEGVLELVDPMGKAVRTQTIHLSARGTFASSLVIPAVAEHGGWDVVAKFRGEHFRRGVSVAVYHVPRTKLELALAKPFAIVGDSMTGKVTAAWFSGGAMENAPTRVSAFGTDEDFAPPGWENFRFGPSVWMEDNAPGGRNVLNHEAKGTTDDHGVWNVTIPTRVPMDRPLHITVDASVDDPNGRPMSASAAFWLHPAAVSLGIGNDIGLPRAGTPTAAHVVAVSPDGKAQAGLPITLILVRREWKAIRQKGMGGEVSWQTRLVETPTAQCTATSAAEPVACELTAPQAGSYVIRGVVRDRAGHQSITSTYLYVTGSDAPPWNPDDGDLLVADKAAYAVGDVAHILVKNPAPDTLALVTEERAGIVRSRLVRLQGLTPVIDVPIEARHAPNIQIGVTLIAGRRAEGALGVDSGAPILYDRSVMLQVSPAEHRLAVTLVPEHPHAAPGQKTSVEVTVKDAAGRPRAAEVTLWAVDEGVLALTGEKTPDPFATLYAPIEAAVGGMFLMDTLVRRRAGELKGEDGGGGGEAGGVRSALRDVAFWQAAVEVGADGKARHSFTLPDNLTTWRIMAVAVDGPGDFGSGDAQVQAQKPLMVQPAVPKSVATGDVVELTATVRNRLDKEQAVAVSLALEGPLAADGALEQTVKLAGGRSLEVKFQVHATGPGKAKLTWAAKAPGASDAVVDAVEVRDLQPLETVATWSQVSGNRTEILHKAGNLVPGLGGLDIEVATSLAVGARVAVEALVDYPFECSEQLASRLQGLLALDTLRKDDPKLFEGLATDHRALAQTLVDKLLTRVRPSGGLSLWPHGPEDAEATVWALWVLGDATQHGLVVPRERLVQAAQWLESYWRDPQPQEAPQPTADPAARLAAQAVVDLANDATRLTLWNRRTTLADTDALWLALSYLTQPTQPPGTQALELAEQVVQRVRMDGEFAHLVDDPAASPWGWNSVVQRQALLVELLSRVRPDHPLLPRLTRWLARQQGGHGWRNTHDNALALRGLTAQIRATQPPTGQVSVTVAGKAVLSAALGTKQQSMWSGKVAQQDLQPGDSQVQLVRAGEGPLWLRLAWSYAFQTPPEEGRNRGLLVRRHLLDLKGQPVRGPVKRGETVLVQVEVTAGDAWDSVAVVDRPPAGLEPVDLQFASRDAGLLHKLARLSVTSRSAEMAVQHQELAGREVRWFVSLQPGTQVIRYLARAATRGTFRGAGTHAEAMYRPETFGTSGSAALRIE